MTAAAIERAPLADVCLRCAEAGREPTPTVPHRVDLVEHPDLARGSYRCRHGHAWSTWWTVAGDASDRGEATPAVTETPPEVAPA